MTADPLMADRNLFERNLFEAALRMMGHDQLVARLMEQARIMEQDGTDGPSEDTLRDIVAGR